VAGASEVQAYVELHRAVFESTNMTHAWRARTLGCLGYLHDLDLVAVAPDGRLAAFCIGWLSSVSGTSGQIEPFGVGREFREAGLGRAILLENVRRLANLGACRALVETDTYRSPALDLYESAGFKPIRDVHIYRKNYATEQPSRDPQPSSSFSGASTRSMTMDRICTSNQLWNVARSRTAGQVFSSVRQPMSSSSKIRSKH